MDHACPTLQGTLGQQAARGVQATLDCRGRKGSRVCASKFAIFEDGMQNAVPHLSGSLSSAGLTNGHNAQVPWETQACRALQVRETAWLCCAAACTEA